MSARSIACTLSGVSTPMNFGPAVTLRADGDQLEQVLINLTRNAVDASLETGGGVTMALRYKAAEAKAA